MWESVIILLGLPLIILLYIIGERIVERVRKPKNTRRMLERVQGEHKEKRIINE